jgi:hypothetical protein
MLEQAEMLLLRVGGMVMEAVQGVFSEEEDLSECVRLLDLGGGGGVSIFLYDWALLGVFFWTAVLGDGLALGGIDEE